MTFTRNSREALCAKSQNVPARTMVRLYSTMTRQIFILRIQIENMHDKKALWKEVNNE